jgi:hypothetical protein
MAGGRRVASAASQAVGLRAGSAPPVRNLANARGLPVSRTGNFQRKYAVRR